jgi:hypothetical protein
MMIFGFCGKKVGDPGSNAEMSTSYSGEEAFVSLKYSHGKVTLNA